MHPNFYPQKTGTFLRVASRRARARCQNPFRPVGPPRAILAPFGYIKCVRARVRVRLWRCAYVGKGGGKAKSVGGKPVA